MCVIPVERLGISGLCNLSLYWYECLTMHFRNHFKPVQAGAVLPFLSAGYCYYWCSNLNGRTTWSLYLAPTQRSVKPWDKGARGWRGFQSLTSLTNHLNSSYSCHRLGEQEHTHIQCPHGDFARHKVQEQPPLRTTPTHRHQGNPSSGLAVHMGIVSFTPVTEKRWWSKSRLQKADLSV